MTPAMRIVAFLALLAAFPGPVWAQGSTARDTWTGCVMAKARELAQASAEPAGTVADAALGSCGREEAALRRELDRVAGGDLALFYALLDDALGTARRQAIAEAVTARAG